MIGDYEAERQRGYGKETGVLAWEKASLWWANFSFLSSASKVPCAGIQMFMEPSRRYQRAGADHRLVRVSGLQHPSSALVDITLGEGSRYLLIRKAQCGELDKLVDDFIEVNPNPYRPTPAAVKNKGYIWAEHESGDGLFEKLAEQAPDYAEFFINYESQCDPAGRTYIEARGDRILWKGVYQLESGLLSGRFESHQWVAAYNRFDRCLWRPGDDSHFR